MRKTKTEGKQREHVSVQSLLASIITAFNPRGGIGYPESPIFTHTFYTHAHKLPTKNSLAVPDLDQKQNKTTITPPPLPPSSPLEIERWVFCGTLWIHLNQNESKELIGNPCLIAGMWWKSNKTKSSITWRTGWGFSLGENGVVQCKKQQPCGWSTKQMYW